MDRSVLLRLALSVAVVAVDAQKSICSWPAARAGVVRDTWWLEGGILSTGVPDSSTSWTQCETVTPRYGSLYKLYFGRSFDIARDNTFSLFEQVNETQDGSAPIYADGVMFADNDEWYTFGGKAFPEVSNTSTGRGIVRNGLYPSAPLATQPGLGINPSYPPNGDIKRYVTAGAGVSIPSESLGFYFSGARTTGSTPISWFADRNDKTTIPDTIVNTMLMINTQSFGSATWSESQLSPSFVTPRVGASMVWIPTGLQGTLVVVGGAMYLGEFPEDLNSTQVAANNNQMPGFVRDILLYDIKEDTWYTQTIASDTAPLPFAKACAVAAWADDGSAYQIYFYGGYDANVDNEASDEVWILSLPAFQWFRAAAGSTIHGRYSHACTKPLPNQMIIAGGITKSGLPLTSPAVDVFDLYTLTWTGRYDATATQPYQVPGIVSNVIGGNASGSASRFANMTSELRKLLTTKYPGNITEWYPYTPVASPKEASKQPSWMVPVIASVVAFVAITIIAAVTWFCFCSPAARKKRISGGQPSASEANQHGFLTSWLKQHANNPYPPMSPKSVASEDVTEIATETTSPRYEVPGFTFYKSQVQRPVDPNRPAEVDGESQFGHTRLYSQSTSPTTVAPSSPHSSELPASGVLDNSRSNYSFKDHHMYPHGFDGASVVSSPTQSSGRYANARVPNQSDFNPMFPYELPENQSRTDLSQTLRPPLAPRNGRSITDSSASISEPTDVDTQSHSGMGSQLIRTPPLDAAPITTEAESSKSSASGPPTALSNRPGHQRNQSSQTSIAYTLTPTTPDHQITGHLNVSPGEEWRRSEHIKNLPDRTAGIGPRRNVIAAIEEHGPERRTSLEKSPHVLVDTHLTDRPRSRSPSQSPRRAESQPLIQTDSEDESEMTKVKQEVRRIESRELNELQQQKVSSPTEYDTISSFTAYQNDSNRLALNNNKDGGSNTV